MTTRTGPARLPGRHGALHLRAALDEHARHGAPRGVRRRGGHGARRRGDLGAAGGRAPPAGSSVAIVAGFAVGIPLSRVPLTAVPQRTALSHAFGGLAAGLVGTGQVLPLVLPRDPSSSPRSAWCAIIAEVILGFLTFTGSLMAAGKLQEVKWIPQRPVTYPLQNVTNIGLLVLAAVLGVGIVLQPTAAWAPVAFAGHRAARARLRRAADHPDRRRRHADGDRDPQLLRRAVRGGDGLRARQQAAHHRRRPRRLQRPDPVDHHVQGDEPLVHQRAVRRVRPGAAGEGGRRGAALQGGNHRGRGAGAGAGQPGRHRARLRHGGGTGAAQGARALRSAPEARRSRSSSRSTPWPAACRGT